MFQGTPNTTKLFPLLILSLALVPMKHAMACDVGDDYGAHEPAKISEYSSIKDPNVGLLYALGQKESLAVVLEFDELVSEKTSDGWFGLLHGYEYEDPQRYRIRVMKPLVQTKAMTNRISFAEISTTDACDENAYSIEGETMLAIGLVTSKNLFWINRTYENVRCDEKDEYSDCLDYDTLEGNIAKIGKNRLPPKKMTSLLTNAKGKKPSSKIIQQLLTTSSYGPSEARRMEIVGRYMRNQKKFGLAADYLAAAHLLTSPEKARDFFRRYYNFLCHRSLETKKVPRELEGFLDALSQSKNQKLKKKYRKFLTSDEDFQVYSQKERGKFRKLLKRYEFL